MRDLESRNGVRVNGRRCVKATLLSPGDLVEIAPPDGPVPRRQPREDPAGVALPTVTPAPVDRRAGAGTGFEDDRTRVSSQAPPMSTIGVGADRDRRELLAAVRDAGDVAISRWKAPCAWRCRERPRAAGRARLGVQDLMATAWGWRVLGQGVLLAGIVFLMVAIPMLNWLTA